MNVLSWQLLDNYCECQRDTGDGFRHVFSEDSANECDAQLGYDRMQT